MTDTFFSQLEGTAVCELLSRTGLQDAALIVVAALKTAMRLPPA